MSESRNLAYVPNILTVDEGSSPKSFGLGGGYPSGTLSTNASELIFEGGNASAGGRLVLDENGVILQASGASLKINNQTFPSTAGNNGQILTVINNATGELGWQTLGGGTTIKAIAYTYATLFS